MDTHARIQELESLIEQLQPEDVNGLFDFVREYYDDIYIGIVAKYRTHFQTVIEAVRQAQESR